MLAEIINIASATEDKINDSLISNLADVEKVCNGIQATFLGTAGITIDDIDRVCQKIKEKISRGLTARMTDVYTYMFQAGFPVPTIEQVKYAVATKDYVGSMVSADSLPTGIYQDASIPVGSDLGPVPTDPSGVPIGVSSPPTTTLPQPVNQLPSGGFTPAPCTGNLLVGAVIPPPCGAPTPGSGPGGNYSCPPGWIASSPRPGYQPYCYPGPLMSVINPTEPNAPYGYDPLGSGQPLCQDGSVQPFSGYCSPTIPGGAGPPGSQPPTTTQPPPSTSPCPPGQVPTQVQGPTGTLTVQPPLNPTEPVQNSVGQYCNIPLHFFPEQFGQTNVMQSLNGIPTWAPGPWNPTMTLPGPPEGFQVVDIHHWSGGAAGQGWQDLSMLVPAGNIVFSDPESGILWAAPTVPPYGCPVAESQRSNFATGPTGQVTCVPATTPPGACGRATRVDCPEPYKPVQLPAGDGDDPCEEIKKAIDKLGTSAPKISDVITFMGDVAGTRNGITNSVLAAFIGSDQPVLPALVKRFADWCQKIVSDTSQGFNCDRSKLLPLAINRAIFGFIDKWLGIIPEQLTNELRQLSNTVCQSELPSVTEADRGYLKDVFSEDEWACYVKAAGQFLGPARKLRDAGRTRPTVHQVLELMQKEKIGEDEADKRLRELGVTDDKDGNDFRALMEKWPTFDNLIRFMVRDVFNEQTVTDAKLDQGFEANYTEKAKKYGKAAGVPDELAKYFWRAHWQIPSYTMLREMLFRLRPDEYPPDMAVDQEVMRKALEQDDWAPGFVKRMIEISYHRINRTDGILMYMMHTLDDDGFVKVLMSDGYKEADARMLQEHYKVKRRINDYLKAGYPTLKQATALYARCQIDPETLNDVIGKLATSDDQATATLEAADIARAVWERKQAVSTIQREFRLGLLSDTEATQKLSERGVDAACIPGLVRAMRRNRQQGSKYLSASQLCEMRADGLITDGEQLEALIRQGWSTIDATRIVAVCDMKNAASAAKELSKQAAASAKKAAAEEKAAAKAAKAKKA